MFDPLVERALRFLCAGCTPRVRLAGDGEAPEQLAAAVAERLQADALPAYAWLDVGLWGPAVHRSAAEVALRVHAVAVTGDEVNV